MRVLTVAISALSVLQVVVCGFKFNTLFCFAGRILFLMKIRGVKVPIRPMIILEAVPALWAVMIPFLLQRPINWVVWIVQCVISGIVVALERYDDTMLIYEEVYEDESEDDELW